MTKIKGEKKIVQIKDKGADSCDETDSDAEAEAGRWNPYTEFLQNIEDEDSEDEEVPFQTFTSSTIRNRILLPGGTCWGFEVLVRLRRFYDRNRRALCRT